MVRVSSEEAKLRKKCSLTDILPVRPTQSIPLSWTQILTLGNREVTTVCWFWGEQKKVRASYQGRMGLLLGLYGLTLPGDCTQGPYLPQRKDRGNTLP